MSLVTKAEYVQVYPEESISTVTETIRESRKEVVVEEIVVQKEEKKLPKQIIPVQQKISLPVREIDDDWFLLLDVVPRETAYVPPGTRRLLLSLPHINYHMKYQAKYSDNIQDDSLPWLKLEDNIE